MMPNNKDMPVRSPQCTNCGYPLLQYSAICPECGTNHAGWNVPLHPKYAINAYLRRVAIGSLVMSACILVQFAVAFGLFAIILSWVPIVLSVVPCIAFLIGRYMWYDRSRGNKVGMMVISIVLTLNVYLQAVVIGYVTYHWPVP